MAIKSLGVDISDHSIEAVEVRKNGDKLEIVNIGRTTLAAGIVERGLIKNREKLVQELQTVFRNAKPDPIRTGELVFGLPESRVYVEIFDLPVETANLRAQVTDAVNGTVPLKPEVMSIDYKILDKTRDKGEANTVRVITAAVNGN